MVDHYSIHDIVTLTANTEIPIPDYFKTESIPTPPDIEVVQGPVDRDAPSHRKKKRKDYSIWRDGEDLVFDYEALDLKLVLGDVEGATHIRFTARFAKLSADHVHTLINVTTQLKLLQEGYTFIHAGCVTMNDAAVLIPAMGSTGKTFTSLSLVDGDDSLFMSDDVAILGRDGSVYAYPDTIGTGPYVLENEAVPELSVNPTISSKLAQVPLISIIFGKFSWLYRSKDEPVPDHLIAPQSTVSHAFIISHGDEPDPVPISVEEAVSRTMTQHYDTFSPYRNFAMNYYAFLFDYNLADSMSKMRSILTDGLSSASCYDLRSNDLEGYKDQIRSAVERDTDRKTNSTKSK